MSELTNIRQSEVKGYLACGRRYQLESILGMPRKQSWKSILGTSVHRGIELAWVQYQQGDAPDFDESKLWKIHEGNIEFSDKDLKTHGDIEGVRKYSFKAGIHVLDHYKDVLFPQLAMTGQPIGVEELIELEYNGVALNGTIDLIEADGSIRDHKTTTANLNADHPDYELQLAIYSWLYLQATGSMPPRASLDIIKAPNVTKKGLGSTKHITIEIKVNNAFIKMGEDAINQAIAGIRQDYFPRNAMAGFGSMMCKMCPHRGNICIAGDMYDIDVTPKLETEEE